MLKPLQNRVLIKKQDAPEQTAGGLYIPKTASDSDPSFEAMVVAVGEGKILDNGDRVEVGVKPGDRIIVGRYSGSQVKLDGEDHLVISGDDILGVVEN